MLAEGNKKAQVELGDLIPGIYSVEWKVLSADQHAIRGSFTFTVASPAHGAGASVPIQSPVSTSPSPPNTHQEMAMTKSEDSEDRIFLGRTAVRWLSYLAMILLFGGFAFRSLVLRQAVNKILTGDERIKADLSGDRRVIKTLWFGAITLAVTSVLALVLQTMDVFDKSFIQALSPSVLAQTLATGYGPSWILQAGTLVAMVLVLLLISRRSRQNPAAGHPILWWIGLAAGAAMLIAPTWIGHAMVSAKHFRIALFSDWLHLLAGGFWVGGLFHLALTWPTVLPTTPTHLRPLALHYLIRFFTRMAMPSVVLLVLAGLYNTWAHIPGIRALWTTPYGQALSLKVLLVLLMLLLGAVNNYYFGKRAARMANEHEGAATATAAQLERGFYRSVVLEASLGIIVLLVTAVLVFLTPARNHPAMESGDKVIQQQRREVERET